MLVAKALKIELNLKVIDLQKGDNKTPEFLKVQHKILLYVLPGKNLIPIKETVTLSASIFKHVGKCRIPRPVTCCN